MNNKKITILFIIIATMALLGIVGFTVAYFTSTIDFENVFNTPYYETQAIEVFESPENWTPGDITPKELYIVNTGDVDVRARVCVSEKWESENGDELPLKQNGERVVTINLTNTSDWSKKGNCYYYYKTLEPDDETSTFMDSVAFNVNTESDIVCTTSTNNGVTEKTCESSGDGYDSATYTLTLTVETIQADAVDVLWPNPVQVVSRQYENEVNVGDEVTIGSEHFYVVSSDQNETVLLAKYNLLVGDIFDYDEDTSNYTLVKTLSSSDTGYGLQSSTARGWIPLESGETTAQFVGTVGFSGTNYWDNGVCQNTNSTFGCTGTYGLLSEYSQDGESYSGSPYPYVYRSNIGNSIAPSIVYNPTYGFGYAQNNGYTISYYVEQYVSTLKGLGAPETISGRLLSYEETINLGCNESDYSCSPLDEDNQPTNGTAPNWLYNTTYWLGSVYDHQSVWDIYSSGGFGIDEFDMDYIVGVRPVIEISTNELLPPNRNVYSYERTNLNQPFSSTAVVFGTPERAMNSIGGNNNFFFKHVLENNIVKENYGGFIITPEMVNNDSNLKAGTYYIRGGGATYDDVNNRYNNDSIYYDDNVDILTEAYGVSNCEETESYGVIYYNCSTNNSFARAYKDGSVKAGVSLSSPYCGISPNGDSEYFDYD